MRVDAASPWPARASAGRRPSHRAPRATRTPACSGQAQASAACATQTDTAHAGNVRKRVVAHGAGAHALGEQRRLRGAASASRLAQAAARTRRRAFSVSAWFCSMSERATIKRRSASSALTDSASFPLSASRCSCAAARGQRRPTRDAQTHAGAYRDRLLHRIRVEVHLAGNQLQVALAKHRVQLVQVRGHVSGAAPATLVGLQRGCRSAFERAVTAQPGNARCRNPVSARWCIPRPQARSGDARDAPVGEAGLINQGGRLRCCVSARERVGASYAERRTHQAQTSGCRWGCAARQRAATAPHNQQSPPQRPWVQRGLGPRAADIEPLCRSAKGKLRHRRPSSRRAPDLIIFVMRPT